MYRFVTLPYEGSKAHVALWEEAPDGKLKVLSVHKELEQVPGFEELDIYRFDRQCSFDTGLPTNGGHYPVADCDGKPLWVGARIRFMVPTFYVNSVDGSGAFLYVDMYGGVRFDSDEPMNVYDNRGMIRDRRREQYNNVNTFHHNGPFKGFRTLESLLGDPHEHGTVRCFFALDDDPRTVCELVHSSQLSMSR